MKRHEDGLSFLPDSKNPTTYLHLTAAERSEVSTPFGRRTVGVFGGQIFKGGFLLLDLLPVSFEDVQGLLLGPGDVIFPPRAGPSGILVFDQQMAGLDFVRAAARFGGGGGFFPLRFLGELVHVIFLS